MAGHPALCAADPRVKGIHLSRNFGQHYAITAGLGAASGEWVVVMDCDLQDLPEEIPRLYEKACEGYDSVFAQRQHRQDGWSKRVQSWAFYSIFGYLTDTSLDHSVANFGIYHRKVIRAILSMDDRIRYFPTMSQWVGFRQAYLPVTHGERKAGASAIPLIKLLRLAASTIIAFSDKPLRLFISTGFTMSALSLCIAVFYYSLYLTGHIRVQGYASLILSLWFIGGVLMCSLGILGIYIGKTFDQVKGLSDVHRRGHGQPRGRFVNSRVLEWDTRFFRRRVAQVTVTGDEDPARLSECLADSDAEVIYVFLPAESAERYRPVIEAHSGAFYDRKVTFRKPVDPPLRPGTPRWSRPRRSRRTCCGSPTPAGTCRGSSSTRGSAGISRRCTPSGSARRSGRPNRSGFDALRLRPHARHGRALREERDGRHRAPGHRREQPRTGPGDAPPAAERGPLRPSRRPHLRGGHPEGRCRRLQALPEGGIRDRDGTGHLARLEGMTR